MLLFNACLLTYHLSNQCQVSIKTTPAVHEYSFLGKVTGHLTSTLLQENSTKYSGYSLLLTCIHLEKHSFSLLGIFELSKVQIEKQKRQPTAHVFRTRLTNCLLFHKTLCNS